MLAASVAVRRIRTIHAAPAHAPAFVPALAPGDADLDLAGTWIITFQPGIESEAEATREVTAFGVDGTVREALPPAWSTDDGRRYGGAGSGLWAPTGDGTFVYRCLAFAYDEAGTFMGETNLRVDLTLDPSGATLTGTFARRELDVVDVLIGNWEGTVSGTRTGFDAHEFEESPAVSDSDDLPPQPGRPGEPY
jgi:hypothetical protein